jgi:site-specific DNA-cytosine methylase
MRLLELFSGTKSVSKAVGHLFTEIVSLDNLQEFNPTICSDILSWDYKVYPPGYFDVIWASPPCTEYSKMKYITGASRNLALADNIVKRAIEIIDYFRPDKWFIENPQTGLLKDREFMLGIPFTDVDYCMYSDWGYRKRTRIWLSTDYEGRMCNKQCGSITNGIHKSPIMPFKIYKLDKKPYNENSKDYLYRIPDKLIRELFESR